MPWESTWFIFSCNPLVHSSLSNRNTFCRNDKSLTNEFRRSVAHIIRLKDPQKSPKKNHLLPGSTNMINCKSDCCNSSVMIIWQKYPLTLEPWWVDPLTKHLSSFHLHHLHHKHMALSLSQLRHAFLDTSRWNLQSRDPHWSLPNQSGSYGFQWRSGWLWRRILQQHIFCFLLFRDPPIWPNQFYCEWSKKKITLKETSKGHLARSPHGRWRSPGIAKNHQCSTIRSSCACILSLQLNFLSCHVHTSALLQ